MFGLRTLQRNSCSGEKGLLLLLEDAVTEYQGLLCLMNSGLPLDALMDAIKICEDLTDQVVRNAGKQSERIAFRLLQLVEVQSEVLQQVVLRHVAEGIPLMTLSPPAALAEESPMTVITRPCVPPVSRQPTVTICPPLRPASASENGIAQLRQVLPHLSEEQAVETLCFTDQNTEAAIALLLNEAESATAASSSPRRPAPPALIPVSPSLTPHIASPATTSSPASSPGVPQPDADASSPDSTVVRRRHGSRSGKPGVVRLHGKRTRKKSRSKEHLTPRPDLPESPSEDHLRAQQYMAEVLGHTTALSPNDPSSYSDGELGPTSDPDSDHLPQTLPAREASILAGKERLGQRLRSLGMEEVVMADDGHCQFRAMAHQLCGSADHHLWVREQVVEHLTRHRADFTAYFDGEVELTQYLDSMARNDWGDEITLRCFADAFGVVVHVVMSTGNPWHRSWEPSDATTGSRHVVISYLSPVHYNSVMPAVSPRSIHLLPNPSAA
eukprot:GGOE01061956.1.p1 GENE.GGOE01061956.1~~GGOE01061956.1.p1  ORF type:complete len:506 (+),score=108.54 GGOE01061956.1:26-1519(+)